MKKFCLVLIAFLTAFFALSCDTGDNTSSTTPNNTPNTPNTPNIPSELVAKWYYGQALADADGTATYEITSDGKLLTVGVDNGYTVSVSGNIITVKDGQRSQNGTVKYSISETALSLTEATNGCLLANGSWYKRSEISYYTVTTNPDIGSITFPSNGGNIITGYTGNGGNITIPAEIGGIPVTVIANGIYIPNLQPYTGIFENKNITNVVIPNSVTYIGSYAFRNNQLTGITIPNNVTYIGMRTFENNQLASITIPDSVNLIRENTFQNNKITSVTIPDSVTKIDSFAFENNPLTSITIGANVEFQFSSFPGGEFYKIYNDNNKAAGTYTRPNTSYSTTWTKQ